MQTSIRHQSKLQHRQKKRQKRTESVPDKLHERYQLHIKIEGQHIIRGSPFSIAVKSPVDKIGTPITAFAGMDRP